jgi:tight adherence protein B
MIAGALAGAASAAWVVVAVGAWMRRRDVRRRLQADGAPSPAARRAASGSGRVAWAQRWFARRTFGARRRADGPADDLASACDEMSRRLRSGQSLAAAIIGSADAKGGPFVTGIARSARLGEQLSGAIERAAALVTDADTELVAQVLGVVAEHGGSQAEAIDRAAATLRERAALRAERAAQAASARLSTRVMTVLPVGFTGVVAAADPDVRAVLLGTPIGWSCIAVGLGLNLIGRAWARRAVGS